MKTEYRRLLDSLNYFGTVNNFSINHEYGSPPHYEIDLTPYSSLPHQTITWNASSDTRVRNIDEKLNKVCEEINRNLTKSILDEHDLSYIDTDIAATIAAREEFKKYILEGKNMQFKRGAYELALMTNKYEVKKIVRSGPCTIVFWEDNTKTVVRLEEGKEYDEYAAFTAALAKKVYDNNSKIHKILEKKTKRDLKEKIKNAKTVDLFSDIPEEKKKASRESAIKRKEGEL